MIDFNPGLPISLHGMTSTLGSGSLSFDHFQNLPVTLASSRAYLAGMCICHPAVR